MRKVFRIREWYAEEEPSRLRLVLRCNWHPSRTTIGAVIESCFPGATTTFGDAGFMRLGNLKIPGSTEGDIWVEGQIPSVEELGSVLTILTQILTVCDDANVSHCLDLYRVPVEGLENGDWPYTDMGRLVYRAKYKHNMTSAREIADRLARVIESHPALSRADMATAVPPSGARGHFDGPAFWKPILAQRLGFQEVTLSRTRRVTEQKGIESLEERSRNQEDSMACAANVDGKAVLVLDDLYMEGDTMKEAVRALRANCAAEVFALSAVKTAKGTRGGAQDLLPGAEYSDESVVFES